MYPRPLPLDAERVFVTLEQAATVSQKTEGRPFNILDDRNLSEGVLRDVLARFHVAVIQHRFRQAMLELWHKRAKSYGTEYATVHDPEPPGRENGFMFFSYAVQQDRNAKPCLTFTDVKREVEEQVRELGKLQVIVRRLREEREAALETQMDPIEDEGS